MNIVTRFAPSPTGRLHLGHAYSAVLAHNFARERNGAFLLRIEDIDPGRSRAVHVDGIIEDLLWLGLEWDADMIYQSERLDLYAEALERLKARGLAYPCFCTRSAIAAEIAASASAPHGPPSQPSELATPTPLGLSLSKSSLSSVRSQQREGGLRQAQPERVGGSGSLRVGPDGPVYPGTCRKLAPGEREARMAAEPHAWRLDVARAEEEVGPLLWHDESAGEVRAEPGLFGDVVLARKDAPVSYHLAVTVDDAAQGVTDIVRGTDLFAATHVHRLLQALLDLPAPSYHHHPLLLDSEGRRLAKRAGAPSLAELRSAGADPKALVEALAEGRLPAGYSLAGA